VIRVEGSADLVFVHPVAEIVQDASRSLTVPLSQPAFGSAIGRKPSEKEPGVADVRGDGLLAETLGADGALELGEPGLQLSDGQGLPTGWRGIGHSGSLGSLAARRAEPSAWWRSGCAPGAASPLRRASAWPWQAGAPRRCAGRCIRFFRSTRGVLRDGEVIAQVASQQRAASLQP